MGLAGSRCLDCRQVHSGRDIPKRRVYQHEWCGSAAHSLASGLRAQLPQNLAEHSEQDRGVAAGDLQAADQAAHFLFCGGGGEGVDVAAVAERIEQQDGDLFGLSGGGGFDFAGKRLGGFRVASQLVEAQRDGLAEIHGEILAESGDPQQPVTVAHVFVGEAEFLGAEQQSHRTGGGGFADGARAVLEAADGVLQFPVTDGGGADDQAAIGDGVGNGRKFRGLAEQRSGADGGAGFAEGDVVGIDHAQPREAEVGHGAGGSPEVDGVARRDHHHAEVGSKIVGDGSRIPGEAGRIRTTSPFPTVWTGTTRYNAVVERRSRRRGRFVTDFSERASL